MRLFHKITLIVDRKQLLARFWKSASQFWRIDNIWASGLTIFLIVVVLLQLMLQVLLNLWNRNFFDSLERKVYASIRWGRRDVSGHRWW